MTNSRRFPAEWEKQQGILLCLPHNGNDWPGKYEAIQWAFIEFIKKIATFEEVVLVVADEKLKAKVIGMLEIAEVNITKEYNFKIAAIIGYKKSAKLLNLEQEFRRELLKRLKENNRQGNNQRQGQGQHSIKR